MTSVQHPQRAAAQAAPPPAAPAPAPAAPAAEPAPAAPEAAPAPAPAPAPLAPAAEPAPPPPAVEPAPIEATVEPVPEEAEAAPAPISVAAWARTGLTLHGTDDPEKMEHLTGDAVLELHFDGNITKEIGLTANAVAAYPEADPHNGATDPDPNGTVELLDLIGRFDLTPPFNVWVGRMLVPSDRANFSGNWFASPWFYAGTYIPGAYAGPRQGPNGRNDGMTVWGDIGEGLFKYYVSAFDLHDTGKKPLWSGRLNLSLIGKEPGYYHSSTYYGAKDILAIGVAVQVQNDGSGTDTDMDDLLDTFDDYTGFNADVLFEKDLAGSGVLTIEGAFYKFEGDYEPLDFSYLGLVSYLTPDKVGPGKIQPLVRLQGSKLANDEKALALDVQVGYVISDYAARLALGYQFSKVADQKINKLFLGAQFQK